MTFTLTSFRSYLIQRPKDKSDPDPKFGTVIFHIWPLMLFATLAHLTLLTCVAGLIGPYIFPALVIRFFVNLAALLLNWRLFCTGKEKTHENIELQPNIERTVKTSFAAPAGDMMICCGSRYSRIAFRFWLTTSRCRTFMRG